MRKKRIILLCLLLAAVSGSVLEHLSIRAHNRQLRHAVTACTDQAIVSLNDVVPFAWDTLYTFAPYQSKDEIARIIGFESAAIRENQISEGMVHLLFVRGDRVTASVLGHPDALDYRIDFPGTSISHAAHARFRVTQADGITTLRALP